jgi:hypothetical protein
MGGHFRSKEMELLFRYFPIFFLFFYSVREGSFEAPV